MDCVRNGCKRRVVLIDEVVSGKADKAHMDKTNRHYTIGELAELAGVSTRTLRHYESLGLLVPQRAHNGYRSYSEADAKVLAQIQAMKLCGLPLATIKQLIQAAPSPADIYKELTAHLHALRAQGESLNASIQRTQASLAAIERLEHMSTNDAFEELKAQGIKQFEETYGQEARELYGDETIDASNKRMMNLSQDEWDAKELLEESIKVQLRLAFADGDPESESARELARMHERWIAIHWGSTDDKRAYLGLVQGYLADPRFVAYYDSAAGEGATEFLVQAITAYQAS